MDIKEQARLIVEERNSIANKVDADSYATSVLYWEAIIEDLLDAQLEKAYPIFFEAGYQAGLSQQETPRIDLECELADDEFRKEFHIAWKKDNMEMYKAGIKKGIKKGQRRMIKWLRKGSMDTHTHIFQVSEEKWQSYLKECID